VAFRAVLRSILKVRCRNILFGLYLPHCLIVHWSPFVALSFQKSGQATALTAGIKVISTVPGSRSALLYLLHGTEAECAISGRSANACELPGRLMNQVKGDDFAEPSY
jgi:hypothetical protein